MSDLLGAIAPETGRREIAEETAIGVARDALAARMIADAAQKGTPAAAAFTEEAQQMLGACAVRRARAARLRNAAATAATAGYLGLSRAGSDAALVEERAADRMAASVCQGVREAHGSGFGYVTPEEAKLLKRKRFLESRTQNQLEADFSKLTDQMIQSADNYGAYEDDDEEVGCSEVQQIGVAADLFGGDLPAVFGANVYSGFFAFLKPSEDRLRKRLARKKRKLTKVTAKLEAKEDAGKKGFGIKMLRRRSNRLEKAIARIEGKLEAFKSSAKKVFKSKVKAKKIEQAETQAVKEAVRDEDDDIDDTDADDELAAALELFGRAPRRMRRARRRVRRLRAGARRAGPGRRGRRLKRRARRIHSAMRRRPGRWARWHRRYPPMMMEPAPAYPVYYPVAEEVVLDLDSDEEEDPDQEAWLAEEEALAQRFGAEEQYATELQLTPERAGMVGYFAKRVQMYGGDVENVSSFGEGVADKVGGWLANLFGKKKPQSAASTARASRKPSAVSRTVQGAGGYVYQQSPDNAIVIAKTPSGQGPFPKMKSGKAWAAILREIGPFPGTAMPTVAVKVRRERDPSGHFRSVRTVGPARNLMKSLGGEAPLLGVFGAQMAKGPFETLFSTNVRDIPGAVAQQVDAELARRGLLPEGDDPDSDLDDRASDDEDDDLGGRRRRRRRLCRGRGRGRGRGRRGRGRRGPSRRRQHRNQMTRTNVKPSRRRMAQRGRTIARMESRGRLSPRGQQKLAAMKRLQVQAESYWRQQGSSALFPGARLHHANYGVLEVMGAQLGSSPGEAAKLIEKQIRKILGQYKWKLARYVRKLTGLAKQHDQLLAAGRSTGSVDDEMRMLLVNAGVSAADVDQVEDLGGKRDALLRSGVSGTYGGAFSDGLFSNEVSHAA